MPFGLSSAAINSVRPTSTPNSALGGYHMLFNRLHVLRALALGDADAVRAARDAHADIFLPVRRIQTVDTDDDLGVAVVNRRQRVIQGEARRVLLVFGNGVLKIEHDGVAAIDISVLNQSRLLRVHEHHRAAQAETFRLRAFDHWITPPHGIPAALLSQLRNTAHSTRALSVQSSAPLSTTVTLPLFTSRRSRVSSTVWRICRRTDS